MLSHLWPRRVALILMWSVVGILGSYSVAWFGIRMNTYANSRTAFASLRGKPLPVYEIPLTAGMSIGVLLICVELIMMLVILLFVPRRSGRRLVPRLRDRRVARRLGAAYRRRYLHQDRRHRLRPDEGRLQDQEDDPRNPGVIADCTGDNAGDSVGPTAGRLRDLRRHRRRADLLHRARGHARVQGAAPGVDLHHAHTHDRHLDRVASRSTARLFRSQNANKDKINFEAPLTSLVWLTSLLSIVVTFVVSTVDARRPRRRTVVEALDHHLVRHPGRGADSGAHQGVHQLAARATPARSWRASREGGASLTILSGLVAGNFSVFWKALTLAVDAAHRLHHVGHGPRRAIMSHEAVFCFGLVAFGLLGMGPVTIAVDSYGPGDRQRAEHLRALADRDASRCSAKEVEKQFGFKPDFAKGKHFLEDNDGAGNTFKATAKPVLIATAVAGATTMIFSIILLLQQHMGEAFTLSLVEPRVLLGLLMGGATVYWFTGASMQAVTTGAFRAVEYIKQQHQDRLRRGGVDREVQGSGEDLHASTRRRGCSTSSS